MLWEPRFFRATPLREPKQRGHTTGRTEDKDLPRQKPSRQEAQISRKESGLGGVQVGPLGLHP